MIDIVEVDEVCIYSYISILTFQFMLLGDWTIWQYPLTYISIAHALLEWKLPVLIYLSLQDCTTLNVRACKLICSTSDVIMIT